MSGKKTTIITDASQGIDAGLVEAITSDAVVVVAAGNQGPLPRTITAPGGRTSGTVGASVDRPDGLYNFVAHYSSRGPAIHRRSKPDIIAPGGLKNRKGDFHEKSQYGELRVG